MNNPEILAPAGSIDTLYADVSMGADAVYVGAPRFGARAFAPNPAVPELEQAITYCHVHGKRLYLTVNTLLTDEESESMLSMIAPLVNAGLDAAIVQDPGVMLLLHETYPDLALHASTQMALFSGEEAELLRPYGVTRFVPARELSIREIRESREQTDLEIEVFVHGALCVCYSGWCLMSEHIGGRSGNRGMCAGPCRLPYRVNDGDSLYCLNAKDQDTLLRIPELIEAGIDSFKIEGRMKSREYSAYLAYLYRHYSDVYLGEGEDYYRSLVDDPNSVLWRDRKRAMELYNRGGFFSSFLFMDELKYNRKNSSDNSITGNPGDRIIGSDNASIEPHVKGHYGLKVGTVSRVNRTGMVRDTTAQITLVERINPKDVLAIRNKAGETVYEFTTGEREASKQPHGSGNNGDEIIGGTGYTVKIGHSDVSPGDEVFRTRNNSLLVMINSMIDDAMDKKLRLSGKWDSSIGKPAVLEVTGEALLPHKVSEKKQSDEHMRLSDIISSPELIRDMRTYTITVRVEGEKVTVAEKHPVTSDDIIDRLSRTGNSPYEFEELDVFMPDNAFLPLGAIKELRRRAFAEWERAAAGAYIDYMHNSFRSEPRSASFHMASDSENECDRDELTGRDDRISKTEISDIQNALWISVLNMDQLKKVLTFLAHVSHNTVLLHVKLAGFPALFHEEIHSMWRELSEKDHDIVWAFSLPRAYRGEYKEKNEKKLVDFFSCFTEKRLETVFVANSIAAVVFRNKYLRDILTVADENLYMTNENAKRFYAGHDIAQGPKRRYGRIPVMTTAHAVLNPDGGRNDKTGDVMMTIETPKGDRFFVVQPAACDFRIVYTAEPVTDMSGTRIDLTTESPDEVTGVLEKWL
ncbi:MAG: U32 family peptidase [Eubacterium sp.]|nr:U32 family peptidase [Eubacterium sp.]